MRFSWLFLLVVFGAAIPVEAQVFSPVACDLPDKVVMRAALGNDLHTGKMRAGAFVTMNLLEPVHRTNAPDIPAGAALVGHVSDVQRKGVGNNTNTRISVRMDYLQWDSKSMPIRAVVIGFDWAELQPADSVGGATYGPTYNAPYDRVASPAQQTLSVLIAREGRNRLPAVKVVEDSHLGTVFVSEKKDIVVPAGTHLFLQHVND
jgi:hypothetical protein